MTGTDGVGPELVALWAESERRLYPLATTAPEKYEQLIRLARAVSDQLADVESGAGLSDRWQGAEVLANEAAQGANLVLGDLPPLDVAGVGFSLRHREVRELEHRHQQRDLIDAARRDNQAWVELFSRGSVEQGLADPFQAIEMHVRTGVAIVSSVEQDPIAGGVNHVLTVVQLDPESGAIVDPDPGITEIRELDSAERFAVERVELVALIDNLPAR